MRPTLTAILCSMLMSCLAPPPGQSNAGTPEIDVPDFGSAETGSPARDSGAGRDDAGTSGDADEGGGADVPAGFVPPIGFDYQPLLVRDGLFVRGTSSQEDDESLGFFLRVALGVGLGPHSQGDELPDMPQRFDVVVFAPSTSLPGATPDWSLAAQWPVPIAAFKAPAWGVLELIASGSAVADDEGTSVNVVETDATRGLETGVQPVYPSTEDREHTNMPVLGSPEVLARLDDAEFPVVMTYATGQTVGARMLPAPRAAIGLSDAAQLNHLGWEVVGRALDAVIPGERPGPQHSCGVLVSELDVRGFALERRLERIGCQTIVTTEFDASDQGLVSGPTTWLVMPDVTSLPPEANDYPGSIIVLWNSTGELPATITDLGLAPDEPGADRHLTEFWQVDDTAPESLRAGASGESRIVRQAVFLPGVAPGDLPSGAVGVAGPEDLVGYWVVEAGSPLSNDAAAAGPRAALGLPDGLGFGAFDLVDAFGLSFLDAAVQWALAH